MRPPPHPSASPLPSFASRVDVVPRYVSFAESLRTVWRWLRGDRPDWRQRAREARLVEKLVEEIEDDVDDQGVDKHLVNRAIAEALGVGKDTINRDVGANAPPGSRKGKGKGAGANAPPGAADGRRDAGHIDQRDERRG